MMICAAEPQCHRARFGVDSIRVPSALDKNNGFKRSRYFWWSKLNESRTTMKCYRLCITIHKYKIPNTCFTMMNPFFYSIIIKTVTLFKNHIVSDRIEICNFKF